MTHAQRLACYLTLREYGLLAKRCTATGDRLNSERVLRLTDYLIAWMDDADEAERRRALNERVPARRASP